MNLFEVMTKFLMSLHTFDNTTYFGLQDILWVSWHTFDVITYFWHHNLIFDVTTNFLYVLLTLSHIEFMTHFVSGITFHNFQHSFGNFGIFFDIMTYLPYNLMLRHTFFDAMKYPKKPGQVVHTTRSLILVPPRPKEEVFKVFESKRVPRAHSSALVWDSVATIREFRNRLTEGH